MFAITVQYLTGRAVASAFNGRGAPEWPPHPARLFSALVASLAERGRDPDEEGVLAWLERQPAPLIAASAASTRSATVSFVPVNDAAVPRVGAGRPVKRKHLGALPEHRSRQGRSFPSVTPENPSVTFVWPDASLPEELADACGALLAGVNYLGHSASLVALRRSASPPKPTWTPVTDGNGGVVLRVPFEGLLAELDRAHALRVDSGMRGRLPCAFRRYRRTDQLAPPAPVTGVFAEMVVFRRTRGERLPASATTRLAEALRGAAMAACEQPVPEVLSGHAPDGAPSRRPHVAFIALHAVGHRHAGGHVLGAAAVLPRDLAGEERRRVLAALGRVERLTLGVVGAWDVERATGATHPTNLLAETWTVPSRRWESVTPVLLDRYLDDPYGPEAEDALATACEHTGLPRPREVIVMPQSAVPGAAAWHEFLPPRRRGAPRRPRVHVVLLFDRPVAGPVLIGAGRYRGLGLCRPKAAGAQGGGS